MLHNLWNAVLYRPLVNLLAAFTSVVPHGDIGIAIILLTLLVKFVLYPLSQAAIESSAKMAVLSPELNKIKKSNKSKEEQARETMQLYKTHKTNPFSGLLLLFIQIPILFALYHVFWKGITFDDGVLYSFIHAPEKMNMMFLGLVDIAGKSIVLALLAGVSQYLQAHYMPKLAMADSKPGSLQESFGKSMQMQMKFVFPFLITFIAYKATGALALYWITNNLFSVGQQIHARRKLEKEKTKNEILVVTQ